MKVPTLDHLQIFITVFRSTLLKSCNEVATPQTFDCFGNNFAFLEGSMRMHYTHADPSGDSSCTELLSYVIVLDWYKETASALP